MDITILPPFHDAGNWLGSLNAFLSVWTTGVKISETSDQSPKNISGVVDFCNTLMHSCDVRGFHKHYNMVQNSSYLNDFLCCTWLLGYILCIARIFWDLDGNILKQISVWSYLI